MRGKRDQELAHLDDKQLAEGIRYYVETANSYTKELRARGYSVQHPFLNYEEYSEDKIGWRERERVQIKKIVVTEL